MVQIPNRQIAVEEDFDYNAKRIYKSWGVKFLDRANQPTMYEVYLTGDSLKLDTGSIIRKFLFGEISLSSEWGTNAGQGKHVTLDANGRLPSQVLPNVQLFNIHVVSSTSNVTSPSHGDVAVTPNASFIFNGTSWIQFNTTGNVSSVNSLTGAVTLSTDNIAEGVNPNRKYYSDTLVNANTNVAANTAARHTHTNATQLAAITEDHITFLNTSLVFTSLEKTKLTGIQAGATVNDTDANLRNRATHTGTQTASTISDLESTVNNFTKVSGSVDAHSDWDHTVAPSLNQVPKWNGTAYVPSDSVTALPTYTYIESDGNVAIQSNTPTTGKQTWTLTHSLNKRVKVMVLRPDGNGNDEVLEPVIKYPIANPLTTVKIEFGSSVTGQSVKIVIE